MTCLVNTSLNVSQPAVAYSALAGVLAGFAFLALIYVLTDRAGADGRKLMLDERKEVDRVLIALTCGMFGILFSTLEYSILTGDANSALQHGQTSSEELMANISFATALMTLIYGVARLIRSSEFIGASRVIRLIASVAIPGSASTFFAGVIVEIAAESWMGSAAGVCGHNSFYTDANALGGWIAPVGVCSIALSFWALPYVIPARYRERPWIWVDKYGSVIPLLSLLAVFVAGAKGVAYNEYIPQEKLSETECWVTFGCGTGILLAQSALIRFSGERPGSVNEEPELPPSPEASSEFGEPLPGMTRSGVGVGTFSHADEGPWQQRLRRAWFALRISDDESISHAELSELLHRQAILFERQARVLESQITKIQAAERGNEPEPGEGAGE